MAQGQISSQLSLLDTAMTPKKGQVWPSDWKRIAGALILYKIAIALIVLLVLSLIPDFFDIRAWYGNFQYPTGTEPTLVSRITTWDAQHFLYLSHEGTPGANHPSAAFAQGWPWVIRAGGLLTGGNHVLSGMVLANAFSILALILLFQFVRLHFSEKSAILTLTLLLAYPGSLFFSAMYAESLFLFLNILFFAFLYQDAFVKGALFSLLQPIVRAIGVVTFVPFVYYILTRWRLGEIKARSFLWCVAPLLGWMGTYLYMFLATGDATSGSQAGDFYRAQGSLLHIFQPLKFINETFAVTSVHSYLGSLIDRIWMIPLVFSLVLLWKKDKTLFLYSLAMILISAMLPRYASFTRYLAVIFPVFIAFGDYFAYSRQKYGFYFSVVVLFALQVVFVIRYLNNLWVG